MNIKLDLAGYEMQGDETIEGDRLNMFPLKSETSLFAEYSIGVKTDPNCCWVYWTDYHGISRRGVIRVKKID